MPEDFHESEKRRDVFISYAFADSELARTLEQAVVKAGGTAFIAAKDLPGGEKLADEIREYLTDCSELWFLVSPDSLKSDWVATEWKVVWGQKKKIVPILYRCSPEELPDLLREVKCIDFHNYQQLVDDTFAVRGTHMLPAEEEKTVIDDLLSRDQFIDAVGEGRKYLFRGQYANSLAVLEYIRDVADQTHQDYYIILGNIAYNLIHLGRDEDALTYLAKVEELRKGLDFPWHAIARAAAYLHLGDVEKCKRWIKVAEKHPDYKPLETLKHYPELASHLILFG